ncbi:MAG: hypothetical protein NTZ97_02810 [Candidatus Moranbacteria bacterium]|nr:hypothetical protein [Candidatus Moranbacteria bacterium]
MGKAEKAEAKSCMCKKIVLGGNKPTEFITQTIPGDFADDASCSKKCTETEYEPGKFYTSGTLGDTKTNGIETKTSYETQTGTNSNDVKICEGVIGEWSVWLLHPVDCSLLSVLKAESQFLDLAGALFSAIVNPEMVRNIMDNRINYTIWSQVRDFLNLAFILVLLFCAFATIFQVEKYSFRSILFRTIIMALLVNFSYPIVRVIIDFSNVLMYTLINTLLVKSTDINSFASSMARDAGLGDIIKNIVPGKADTSYLIMLVIFFFIFMITLLSISILLVIRTIVLTILIIFSPVAFVGAIIPSSKSEKALKVGQFWDYLFKYSFFGPIQIFMLYVATSMMQKIGATWGSTGHKFTTDPYTASNVIGAFTFYAIPIVILWIGIGFAQSMSIAGAETVKRRAKQFGKWASGLSFAHRGWKAYRKRRDETTTEGWANRMGTWTGSRQDWARSKIAPGWRGVMDARNRFQKDQLKRVEGEYERYNMKDMAEPDIRSLMASGNKDVYSAGLIALADKGSLNRYKKNAAGNWVPDTDDTYYQKMRKAFGDNSQVFSRINNKLKINDTAAAFDHLDPAKRDQAIRSFVNSNQYDVNKQNEHSIGNLETMRIASEEGIVKAPDWEKVRKKYKDTVKKVTGEIADYIDPLTRDYKFKDSSNSIHRDIQKSYTAMTGKFGAFAESAAGDSMQDEIIKDGNPDTLRRFSGGKTIGVTPAMRQKWSDNLSNGQIREIMPRMKNTTIQRDIINVMKGDPRHQQYINDNDVLKNL